MDAACVQVADALAGPGAQLVPIHDPREWRTLFHEAGTCAMGTGEESARSARGRLRALDNLWLADASAFRRRRPAPHPDRPRPCLAGRGSGDGGVERALRGSRVAGSGNWSLRFDVGTERGAYLHPQAPRTCLRTP